MGILHDDAQLPDVRRVHGRGEDSGIQEFLQFVARYQGLFFVRLALLVVLGAIIMLL